MILVFNFLLFVFLVCWFCNLIPTYPPSPPASTPWTPPPPAPRMPTPPWKHFFGQSQKIKSMWKKKFPKESFPPPRCHVSQRSDSSLRISLRCFSSCLRKQTCVKERQLQMSQQRNFNIRDHLLKPTWKTKQPCIGIRRLCETVCEDSLSHLSTSHCLPACARSVIQICAKDPFPASFTFSPFCLGLRLIPPFCGFASPFFSSCFVFVCLANPFWTGWGGGIGEGEVELVRLG